MKLKITRKKSFARLDVGGTLTWKRSFRRNWELYLLLIPVILYFLIFKYYPMYGTTIAFKDFKTSLGIMGSPWLSTESFESFFKWFLMFFRSYKCLPVILNTLILSLLGTLIGFPFPIILALVLNELGNKRVKSSIQTITYAPHFVSTPVVVAMIISFTSPSTGIVNAIIKMFGGEAKYFMIDPNWFRPLYIISSIWSGTGWGAIIYMSALSNIDPTLYEAAAIDGASRFQMLRKITFPLLLPVATIMLILDAGSILSVGYEKVLLLQNSMNISVSEVISTYTYQIGIIQSNYSYSTAIGLFNSLINITVLIIVNRVCRKISDVSLW